MEKIWRKIFYGIVFLAIAIFIREFDFSNRIFADLTSENTTENTTIPALSELTTIPELFELKLPEADSPVSIEKTPESLSGNVASVPKFSSEPALGFVEPASEPVSPFSDFSLSSLDLNSTLTPISVSTFVPESLFISQDSITTVVPSTSSESVIDSVVFPSTISESAIDSTSESIDSALSISLPANPSPVESSPFPPIPPADSIFLNSSPIAPVISDPFRSLEEYGKSLEEKNTSTERRQLMEVILAIDELRSRLDREEKDIEDALEYVYSRHFLKSPESYCSESSYYTFDETGGECIFVNRKVCSREDMKEENRYFDFESCQQEAEILKNMSPVEKSQFNNQKREYLAKLLRLQEEFSYYSVKWKELLDQVHKAKNYNELGVAGNLINEFRMNEGAGKQMTEAKEQKANQSEQSEKFEKSEQSDQSEKFKKFVKPDKSDKPDKSEKIEKFDKAKNPEETPKVEEKSIRETGKDLQNVKKEKNKNKDKKILKGGKNG